MSRDARFSATFWGVRGSIACPGKQFVRYGGNTSCIEIRCDDQLLILDAGTGLRPLGLALDAKGEVDADVLFTHTHLDHIGGLPFFSSAFDVRNRFRFWAGHLTEPESLKNVIDHMMSSPLFPVPMEVFQASIEFRSFETGTPFELGPGLVVKTAMLNHPQGATGYRIEFAGHAICYITDTEHAVGKLDQSIIDLIRGADLVIYDSTYTDEEFHRFVGWGHSTWQEGARICEAAGAKKLVIFHHDPGHTDDIMDGIAEAAESFRPGTIVAREGLCLEL
ncbi:MAG: MBL fold metallo-hydrolase [Rhodospirillaceae bacterium]|nr:MBL fold metallo-hydrolase [Rhodospirillaceae bacterium]